MFQTSHKTYLLSNYFLPGFTNPLINTYVSRNVCLSVLQFSFKLFVNFILDGGNSVNPRKCSILGEPFYEANYINDLLCSEDIPDCWDRPSV